MCATFGLRDVPLQTDSKEFLGLDKYATELAAFAKQCEIGMTIALQGNWGSGKKSLLNLIRGKMRERSNNYVPVCLIHGSIRSFDFKINLHVSLLRASLTPFQIKQKMKRIHSNASGMA